MQPLIDPTLFYSSDFPRRLIRDYAYGNYRMLKAIAFLLQQLPENTQRILDIGCGLGWTSYEMKRARPQASVIGLDLSPKHIELAQQLFADPPGLTFSTQNVLDWDIATVGTVDAIVMVDVYEHIPRDEREALHTKFREMLNGKGVLLLTFPTPQYQQHLRDYHPSYLQPVDEDITEACLEKLASDIGGKVTCAKPVALQGELSQFVSHEYFHACISVGNVVPPTTVPEGIPRPQQERLNHVVSALSVRPTKWEQLLPVRPDSKTVCIAVQERNAVTETFVRAHMELLPATVRTIYGTYNDQVDEGNRKITWSPPAETKARRALRLIQRIQKKVMPEIKTAPPIHRDSHYLAVAQHLRDIKADVVLAEFGPTGVQMLEPCRLAGVPLVVHFHGYDAVRKDTLLRHQETYPRLFRYASKIICVSHRMQQELLQLGVPEEKLVLNVYGVDPSRFVAASPQTAPPVFLGVGRFVEKKAPYLTLLAFAEVVKLVPEARLLMVGQGPLHPICERMIPALGLSDSVVLLGSRSHIEVAGFMRQARCFVQHSLTASDNDQEGTPVGILEAGASGLPVISTRHAGIPDVILEGKTGFLVDEGDVPGMAQYMLQLAQNPDLAGEMGAAARQHIVAHYAMQDSIDRLWAVLKDAINRA